MNADIHHLMVNDNDSVVMLPGDKKEVAIVRTTVALGNSLGISTVAEGAEKLERLAFLRQEAELTIRGFYLSKPIPGNDVCAFVNCEISDLSNAAIRQNLNTNFPGGKNASP